MTRYILLHRLETPEEIIRFEWEGFQFNKEISDTERYIFTRADKKKPILDFKQTAIEA